MENLIGTDKELFDETIEQTVDDELEIELHAQIDNEETRALARTLIADKHRADLYQAAKETVASQTFQITLARLSVVN
jgi:hypothetical protein